MALDWLDEIESELKQLAGRPLEVVSGEYHLAIRPKGGGRDLLCIEPDCGCGAVHGDDVRGVLDLAASASRNIPRLCRAVRELHAALETALELATSHPGIDEESKAARELRRVLERWGRGGA